LQELSRKVPLMAATMPSGLGTASATIERRRGLSCPQRQRSKVNSAHELRADLLQECDFVCELEPSTRAELPGATQAVTQRCGTVLFREGDWAERCYIILAGQVTLSATCCLASAAHISRCSTRASSCSSSRSASKSSLHASSRVASSSSSRAISPASSLGGHVDVINKVAKKLAFVTSTDSEGCDGVNNPDNIVVTLGAGRLFGDLALLQQNPQGFTATCTKDCELLVVEKSEFERVLKEDMLRLTCQKLEFLRKYLPGANDVLPHKAEPLLHCFQKKVVPKGRVILAQDAAAKKCIYLVSKGSVFLGCNDVDMPLMPAEVRMMGSLYRGGVFGSFEDRMLQPCTISCTSASCELYFASGRSLEALPSSLRRSTQKYLCRTAEWRMCDQSELPLERGHQLEVRPSSSRCKKSEFDHKLEQPRRRASDSVAILPGRNSFELEMARRHPHTRGFVDIVSPPLRTLVKKNSGNMSLPSL